MLKICSKCKIEKDVKEFYTSKQNKSGLYSYCKICKRAYQKKYYVRKTKIMTSKERLFEIITEKKTVSLKDLLNKFENKKELFTDIESLIDDRIIGCSVVIGENNAGERYFIKK